MNKNIHHTDGFFKDAYQQFEEEAPARVWKKINAGLDKKEADSNKRKFIFWRRTAILLLLISGYLVLFDSVVFKTNTGRFSNNTIIKKYRTPGPASKTDKVNNAGKKITKPDEKNTTGNTASDNNFYVKHPYTIANKGSSPEINEGILQQKMIVIPSTEKSNNSKPVTELFISKNNFLLPVINHAIFKNNPGKNKKPAENNSFIPFWMMTAFASYDRANYKLDSDLPTNISAIKHRESQEPSFSWGILATRQFNKHWGLQTGLVYSNTAIGISPQKLYALQNPVGDITFKYITSSGYAYIKPGLGMPTTINDSLQTMQGKHVLQSVSVPVMIKYSMGKNKFTITPGAGIEANFITNAKVETEIENPLSPEIIFINKLDGTKSFYLSVVADAELRYRLNKKLSLNFRPAFRYAVSPITKNNVVETFPYSVGLGLGIIYKF